MLDHLLQLFTLVHASCFGCGTGDTLVCLNEDPKGYENPKGIEEDQVHPLVQEIGCNKIGRTAQPFGTERHPPYIGSNGRVNIGDARTQGEETVPLTTVEFTSRQQNHPEPLPIITSTNPSHLLRMKVPFSPSNQLSAPERQRTPNKHRQNLQTDHRQIRPPPPLIRLCIFLPQFGKRSRAICSAEHAVWEVQKVDVAG